MSAHNQKKGLIHRGWDCLTQLGWKHTLYVLRTGEFRIDEDDTFTYAESRSLMDPKKRKDAVMSSAVHSVYDSWIQENEICRYTDLAVTPLFSVVVPVYNVTDEHLTACIESVRGQNYENWELILVDDHSTWKSVRRTLLCYRYDPKIHIIFRSENGNISRATNDGIAVAKGDFIAFMDCDDKLASNALYEMARVLNDHPEYDFIYSDEDKLTEDGSMRHDPFFKPDWSPDTFLSMMYTNHLAVYRTALVKKTGGLRPEFDGSQDYDFTLRFLELTDHSRVGHIPKVLYYWRERKESAATGAKAKPYALAANERAKQEALLRRGISGRTEFVKEMNQYRIVYDCGAYPLVSIIIPSKDNPGILTQCIESIRMHTQYPNYEMILVDNGSCKENQEKILSLVNRYGIHYHYKKMQFNFAKMCNIGAGLAKGKFFLFLNDDIEVSQADWLDRMVGQAMQEHAGAVGAKLLYPGTTRIQHDGVFNRRTGPAHVLLRKDDRNTYYYGRNLLDYNCFAVTGACLLVSAQKYHMTGGMDEQLQVNYNDVDLCLNLYERGFYNVVRNDVVLFHYESVSRGLGTITEKKRRHLLAEQAHMWDKHPDYAYGKDPFYSRNFGEASDDFTMHKWNMVERVEVAESNQVEYKIDEVSYEENHTVLYGYFNWKGSDPAAFRRYILLTAEDGGQLKVRLNHVARKDGKSGFLIRIPDHLLDRKKTSYRVGFLLKSPRNMNSVYVSTHAVIPRKQEEYCEGVHLNPADADTLGHGLHLTTFDRDDDGVLYVRGYFDGNWKKSIQWNCYLAVREKEGMIYYHLWDDSQDDADQCCGFYGKIHSTGIVRAVLYIDRVSNAQHLYPITYDMLCRQLGGDTAYWNRISADTLAHQRSTVFEDTPLFSIVVPLYNTPKRFLTEMIESVCAQTYRNWQLCLADGSDDEHRYVGRICEDASHADHRIIYRRLEKNGGISENTNECLKVASGDWIAFFDHDDLLAPNALHEAMLVLQQRPETEFIYTDEDKVDETGAFFLEPHFKTDYDAELLRTCNYICHFLLVKRELVHRVGGLRTEYNGSQDYDFILRCTERTSNIVHIPKVLYHWRMHTQSTAGNPESKQYAYTAAQKAIEDHLARCGEDHALVERTGYPGYYRVVYPVKKKAGVSIVIRVRDHGKMLERCIEAICEKTSYPRYEILISYPESRKHSMRTIIHHIRSRYAHSHPIHICPDAELEKKARGAYLVELDASCEVQTPDWLERMLGNMERTRVLKTECENTETACSTYALSAVCAKVVNAEGKIISCGLTDHQPGSPLSEQHDAVYRMDDVDLEPLLEGVMDPGYNLRAVVQQTVPGTDQWCYMIRRTDGIRHEKAIASGKGLRNLSGGTIVFCPDAVVQIS